MSKKQRSVSDAKTGYYGYSSETRGMNKSSKTKKSQNSSGGKVLGIILVILQLIASISFVGLILYKKLAFVTAPILAGVIGILLFLLALVFYMLRKSKASQTGAKIISLIVIVILAILIYLIAPIPQMSGKKVSTEPFVVFVSANDTFGEFDQDTIGRSDTNILAVVNPKTYNILMISTPRDYYVPVQAKSVAPESYDKLTHVSLYGNGIAYKGNQDVGASGWQWAQEVHWHPGNDAIMDTLQHLYGFDVKKDAYHYVKLNFTGFADLIDALGGVTIDVDTSFSTRTYASYGDKDNGKRKTYEYTKGEMKMDGAQALTFARERHSFAAGDMQRNQNQVKVLKAMEKKILSGSTLLNYNNVVDSIENSFTTDLDISSMVNLQMSLSSKRDYNGWNIMSFSVIGQPSRQVLTFNGLSKSVVMQDQDSIARAKNLISMTLNGETTDAIKSRIKTYNKEQAGK